MGAVRWERRATRGGDLTLASTSSGVSFVGAVPALAGFVADTLRRLVLSLEILCGVFAEEVRAGEALGEAFEDADAVGLRYVGT